MWKDFKGSLAGAQDSEASALEEGTSLDAVENGLLKTFYAAMQKRHPNRYIFSTYQPAHYTQYADMTQVADAVVFIGDWFLPQPVIEERRRVYQSHVHRNDFTLAELIKQTFRTRCQYGQPVTLYYTPDWKKEFIQELLDYTQATDEAGTSLSVFTREKQLHQELQSMGFCQERQREHILKIVDAYPAFADSWTIILPLKEAKRLLGKTNSRDLKEMLAHWKKQGVYVTLSDQ
jgi:hypothetical protein